MAYELYQSRHKGYEIDNLLDDVVDLNTDVANLKTEYDANKVKMSDGTILPLYLVNTYATKTDLSAKADSTQVAADIATATTDMASNTGVASAIATATADMATNTSVASDIATATTDMATNASVAAAIAAAAYTLPEATTSTLGGVKVDGTTITADADGTIHGASAIAELNDIGDVNAPSPQNDQVLTYDSATSKWIPKTGGGGGGGSSSYIYISDTDLTTIIDGTTTITLSNLSQSNDRTVSPSASDIQVGITIVYDENGTTGVVTNISGTTLTVKTMEYSISAGDGVVITNGEISTDNMPSTDMSEIVSPKPTVKTKQSSFDLLGSVSTQEGQITYPNGTLDDYTFLLLKVNMKNGSTEIGRGNQILIPTVELKLGTFTEDRVQVQTGQSSPLSSGGNSVNIFADFTKTKMSYIYVGWIGSALTNPGFIARLYGIK